MAMGVFQLVTIRGNKELAEIYDLDCARLMLARLNAERDTVKRNNARRQAAWRQGYNAARSKAERERWLSHQPKAVRPPAEVLLTGVLWE